MALAKLTALQNLLLHKYSSLVRASPEEKESIESVVEAIDNYYDSIISCMPGNVYWLDENAVFMGCNQNVVRMFGVQSSKDLKGLSFEEMGRLGGWTLDATKSFKEDTLEVIRTGIAKLNIEELPIPNAVGQLVYFLTSRVPLFDSTGKAVGVVGISIDITERKKMEEQLKIAKRTAEAANRAKTEFLLNMSHDVKTPLAGMISFAEYLNSQLPPPLCEFSQDIFTAGKYLMQFFENCVELSKFENDSIALSKETFCLKQLLHEILSVLQPAIKTKNLSLYIEYSEKIPLHVLGSRVALYRVLLNLIGNAVKFTKRGYIKISAELSDNSTAHTSIVKLTVADTGIGIPEEKWSVIFEKFSRVSPSYAGVYKGHGVGLYIVREFVKAMGGEIHLKSEENVGSEFIVVIPLQNSLLTDEEHKDVNNSAIDLDALQIFLKENVPSLATEKQVQKIEIVPFSQKTYSIEDVSRPHILVVEDDEFAKKAMQLVFDALGCHIDLATCGREAIALFGARKYDLVFMDLGLPDMKGYEIARYVREMEKEASVKVPIFGLSAHASEEEVELSLEAGMTEMLTKPLLKDQAVAVLERYHLKKAV